MLTQLTLPTTGQKEVTSDHCVYTTEIALGASTRRFTVTLSQPTSASSLKYSRSSWPSMPKLVQLRNFH